MQKFFAFFAVIAAVSAQDCGKFSGNIEEKSLNLPWTVQLFERTTNDLLCMGTLISKQHVLIAAHCLFPKPYHNSLMDTTNVQVTVGVGGKHVDLMDVKIHPEWKFNKEKYDADVAVVTLFNPVDVMPICLPPAGTSDVIVPGGIFAGINTIDQSNIRHRVVIEKNNVCFKNFPASLKNVSPRTFCANWPGESLEMSEGLTGAYFYPFGPDSAWFVSGIESQSFVQKNECDIRKHSVFSNVGHYVDWIKDIIKSSKQYKDVQLQCKFAKNYEGFYGCEVSDLVVDTESVRISSVAGQHVDGKSNQDVEYVWIKNPNRVVNLPHFDARIFFPNLLKYIVQDTGLKKISRDNFVGMPKLETLDVTHNELESIPEDALFDLKALVDLFVDNNNLKALPEKLLSHASDLQRFRASNNSVETLEAGFFKGNPILKIVAIDNNKLHKIYTDFRGFNNLKRIDLGNNPCIDTNYNDWRKYKSPEIIQQEVNASCK